MKSAASVRAAELIRWPGHQLARSIAAGEVSAQEAVEAYIARIEQVDPLLNAVVVRLFDEARAAARRADEARQRGESLGPLHGVPITIKECFHVAGTPSTIGIPNYANEKIPADGPLVARLRRAGAIVLGKTNVPQLMLLHETDNPVYGRTNNPWNLDRSPGGSSGGEGAIVAACGSAIGLGSDLGGSIRQPAHSCGVHGLLPTKGRLTTSGSRNNFRGLETIGVQAGPLARSVADLDLAMRVLQALPSEAIEGEVPMPLLDPAKVHVPGLRIGVWTDDGYFPASPSVRRVVTEAAEALRRLGAEVQDFQPPRIDHAMSIYFGLLAADGGRDARRAIGRGPYDWRIKRLVRIGRCPGFLRRALTGLLGAAGQSRLARFIAATGKLDADQYWQLCAARKAYTEEFIAAADAARLDAFLFPPHALPAMKHGSTMHLAPAGSYCFLANLLGVPAGTAAAGRVRAGEESDRPASRDLVERAARDVEQGSVGLPLGVQVASRHWREDIVLAVMGALETHFRTQPDYPAQPPL